ncbi:helix-turn-helix domain-containing protein [Neisseria sp. ZJ106]|uniref:Helix-turn-helix domain-containing protein n=1 Tax=Neisseria lisongii TaxID=2912188 RepID=A0ABY7RMZ0_9NEIS|nr:helix-turn-helix domain-containing protein [Neisseria lisongii]MCF7520442.1 helix-turn-helix domain-containing protein [Neisseria lisongii]WCL71615.1 helix-turn-helix domain-containing protein [Neisseria lisongii]
MTPEQIRTIRHTVKLTGRHPLHTTTQTEFARLLNTSAQTVQSWEQGRRHPSGTALKLLHLLHQSPKLAEQLQTI